MKIVSFGYYAVVVEAGKPVDLPYSLRTEAFSSWERIYASLCADDDDDPFRDHMHILPEANAVVHSSYSSKFMWYTARLSSNLLTLVLHIMRQHPLAQEHHGIFAGVPVDGF